MIKAHPFFKTINFNKLEKIKPPINIKKIETNKLNYSTSADSKDSSIFDNSLPMVTKFEKNDKFVRFINYDIIIPEVTTIKDNYLIYEGKF